MPKAGQCQPDAGLMLSGASLWKQRKKAESPRSSSDSQNWSRYIDSRLRQFGSR